MRQLPDGRYVPDGSVPALGEGLNLCPACRHWIDACRKICPCVVESLAQHVKEEQERREVWAGVVAPSFVYVPVVVAEEDMARFHDGERPAPEFPTLEDAWDYVREVMICRYGHCKDSVGVLQRGR